MFDHPHRVILRAAKDPVRSVGGELAHATGDQRRSWRQPFGGLKALSWTNGQAGRPQGKLGCFSRERGIRMTVAWVLNLPVRLLDALLWLYQRTVSPALSALHPTLGCRFAPTCSHYARGALREHGLFTGLALTIVRLAKCGPWHPGGEDPVPPRSRPVCHAVRRQA